MSGLVDIIEKFKGRKCFVSSCFIVFYLLVSHKNVEAVQEVTLHFEDSVLVNDTVIIAGDIARISGVQGELLEKITRATVGESAPAGYSRFVNSTDFVQFRLRVAFPEITFKTDGCTRVKVSTDFDEKTIKDFFPQIHSFLDSTVRWDRAQYTVTINNEESGWKSYRQPCTITFSDLPTPYPKGNFSILLQFAQGDRVTRIPVSLTVKVRTAVLVASSTIPRGEQILPDQCILDTMDITRFGPVPLTSFSQLDNQIALRTISQGTIIHDRLVRSIPAITKGDIIRVSYASSTVRVSILAVARESGCTGEKIWVENSQTKRLIRVSITGKGKATLLQGGGTI